MSRGRNTRALPRRWSGRALIEYTSVEGENVLLAVCDFLFQQFNLWRIRKYDIYSAPAIHEDFGHCVLTNLGVEYQSSVARPSYKYELK